MIKKYNAFTNIKDLDKKDPMESFLKIINVGYATLSGIEQTKTRKAHTGDDYLFIYIKQGHMSLTLDKQTYLLKEGYSCIIPPHLTGSYTFLKDKINEHYYMYFAGFDVDKILKELKLDKTYVYYSSSHLKYGNKIIMVYNNFKTNKFKYPTINSSLFLQILTDISINHNKISFTKRNSTIQLAVEKMQESYFENLPLDYYAKLCNMSKSNFIKRFKAEEKITPQKYINNIKVNIATELLETTELNISEIAQSLGFEDAYYFSNFFKKNVGISPFNYKKERQIKRKK